MQKTIAKRMIEAKSTVPHFYLEVLACIDKLIELQKICKDQGLKATLTHLFVKCIAHAMEQVPQMNVSWHEGQVQHHGSISIAVAVSTGDDGLITPIIQNTNQLGIAKIIENMNDLVARAKDARLAAHEFQGGSITISSLGMYGVNSVYPIMNLPQASIVGIGAARDELYMDNELVKSRKVCSITISVDHRVINGAIAARFMQILKSVIEEPLQMLI
jgi:pyruvate dehydrogenase E2 component (dihydrolipoamide acetyltransferase)